MTYRNIEKEEPEVREPVARPRYPVRPPHAAKPIYFFAEESEPELTDKAPASSA